MHLLVYDWLNRPGIRSAANHSAASGRGSQLSRLNQCAPCSGGVVKVIVFWVASNHYILSFSQ
jgi:hypothetical protein